MTELLNSSTHILMSLKYAAISREPLRTRAKEHRGFTTLPFPAFLQQPVFSVTPLLRNLLFDNLLIPHSTCYSQHLLTHLTHTFCSGNPLKPAALHTPEHPNHGNILPTHPEPTPWSILKPLESSSSAESRSR